MARRPGLGKGLDALIPGGEEKWEKLSSDTTQSIVNIPIDEIQPNPQQPRTSMNEEALDELAASIKEHGIIQPIIVTESPDSVKMTIIAGERRWRAAQKAGLSMVPAIIRSASELVQLELALIENIQRSNLMPLELASAYQSLSENFSLTHEQIAERVGKSRTSVTNTLRLLNLPDQVKKSLSEGLISEGHARALLSLPNSQSQRAALSTILNLGLNVRQTENLVKKLCGEKPSPVPKPGPQPEFIELENQLRNYFGTKVNMNKGKKGGSLVIYYYSDEELNSIIEKILRNDNVHSS